MVAVIAVTQCSIWVPSVNREGEIADLRVALPVDRMVRGWKHEGEVS
jgi:hypothetical protein